MTPGVHGRGGSLFVGLMFLGLGIGMVFGQPGPGVILGMGAGFIAMALTRGEERGEGWDWAGAWRSARWAGSAVLALIGLGFIAGGLYMLGLIQIPPWTARYIGAAVMLLLGLYFIVAGLGAVKAWRRGGAR